MAVKVTAEIRGKCKYCGMRLFVDKEVCAWCLQLRHQMKQADKEVLTKIFKDSFPEYDLIMRNNTKQLKKEW